MGRYYSVKTPVSTRKLRGLSTGIDCLNLYRSEAIEIQPDEIFPDEISSSIAGVTDLLRSGEVRDPNACEKITVDDAANEVESGRGDPVPHKRVNYDRIQPLFSGKETGVLYYS